MYEGFNNPALVDSGEKQSELEEEILGRLDKLAALCAVQSRLAAEGIVPLLNHHANYSRLLEEQVGDLCHLLDIFFRKREKPL